MSASERRGRVLQAGDLLLEKSGGGEKSPVGFVVLYDRAEPAVCSNFVARVVLKEGMDPRYWTYVHGANYALRVTSRSVRQSTGIQNLDETSYFNEVVPFPPAEAQIEIANYLDRETAEIDAFIADQEELIRLLTERRAATISHAVTKGLDPTAPMKDSGVEWLGQVPRHWSVTRVSRYFSVVLGKMLDAGKVASVDATVLPYVRAANIQESGLDLKSVNEMPFTRAEVRSLDIRQEDLLVVEGGAVGVNVHLAAGMPGWGFQKTVNRVRSSSRAGSTRFLGFALDSLRWNGVIDMLSNKSTIAHLTAEKLERILLAFPPADEQARIVRHIEKAIAEVDSAAGDAREAIALSRERRAALISAAVTGKIDVRESAAFQNRHNRSKTDTFESAS